jgi:hypothetical protein
MNRTEVEFCRQQAERLFALANECVDPRIREKVKALAQEWAERAAAKENISKQTTRSA